MDYNSNINTFYSLDDYNFFPQIEENPFSPLAPEYAQFEQVAFSAIQETAESLTKRKLCEDPEEFETNDVPEIDPSPAEGIKPGDIFPEIQENAPFFLTLSELEMPVAGNVKPNKSRKSLEKRKQLVRFTQVLDEEILRGIKAYKTYDQIAAEMKLPPRQIRNRWNHYLSKRHPELKYKPFYNHPTSTFTDQDEKDILLGIIAGKSYAEIAQKMNKTADQIRYHWLRYKKKHNLEIAYRPIKKNNEFFAEINQEGPPSLQFRDFDTPAPGPTASLTTDKPSEPKVIKAIRIELSQEQDEKIITGIKARKSYVEIAAEMKLTPRKINNRWNQYLSKRHPELKYQPFNNEPKSTFTAKEDEDIVDGLRTGQTFKTIAEKLNRSYDEVSVRWNYYLSLRHPEVTNKWSRSRYTPVNNTAPVPVQPQLNPIPYHNPYPFYYPYPFPPQQFLPAHTPPTFYWKV